MRNIRSGRCAFPSFERTLTGSQETNMPELKKLRRSMEGKIIAGVCAGIAEWLGWSPGIVRILFIVGSFVPIIPGFIVYLILWVILPTNQQRS